MFLRASQDAGLHRSGVRCVRQEKGCRGRGQGLALGQCRFEAPGVISVRTPRLWAWLRLGSQQWQEHAHPVLGGLCRALRGPEPRFLVGRLVRGGCGQALWHAEALLSPGDGRRNCYLSSVENALMFFVPSLLASRYHRSALC